MNFCRSRPDVIGDRQRAPPFFRRKGTFQRREQGLGVAVGQRQHRDFGERLDLVQVKPFRARPSAHSRSEWITRISRHIHHAATLHAVLVAQAAFGEDVALEVTIVTRVGIDQATDRAVLSGHFGLDAAPRLPIAGDHDCAFHRNAQPLQFFIVVRNAVIDVDQRRGDISIRRVRVVRGKLFGLLIGSGVDREGRLVERSGKFGGLYQFHGALFRSRKQDVEVLDMRVQSPFFHLGQQPFGIVLVIRRANVMRARREPLHVLALIVGVGNRAELRLPIALGAGRIGRIAGQSPIIRDRGGNREAENKDSQKGQVTMSHYDPPVDPNLGGNRRELRIRVPG